MTASHTAPIDAILIVDPQNDFCPGGSLAVPDGDRIMSVLNAAIRSLDVPVFVSRDWHPADSVHFGRWPAHCVQDTDGAEFHASLELPAEARVISKGTDPADDAGYSAFEGVDHSGSSLKDALQSAGIRHLLVGGLATDYCVRASVLSARDAGFDVTVLADGMAAIDAEPGDAAMAVADMVTAGATVTRSQDVLPGA